MGIIVTGSRHSIRPSLNLDFANSKVLDPRITFTRASNATYYDGYTSVKAEENLFPYSQDISQWSIQYNQGIVLTTNQTTAPDGTSTADKVTTNTDANAMHAWKPDNINLTSGDTYTVSAFLKQASGTPRFGFRCSNESSIHCAFDLDATSVVNTSNCTASITDVGNDWKRCVMTWTTTQTVELIQFHLMESTSTVPWSYYTANGTDALFVWGAQLEQRDTVTAYTPTTSSPITKYQPALQTAGNNVARFDHNPTTGESLGLLIEESRSNLLTYSEEFDNAVWGKGDCTITANTIIAPDGTLTGDKLVENASTGDPRVTFSVGSSPTATTYTLSFYAKAGERSWSYINFYNNASFRTWFNLSDGTVGTNASGSTASITSVGNGWYRISVTRGISSTVTLAQIASTTSNNVNSYTGDGYSGIYIWGAQLEIGSFPTSYIPTVASTVTRSADSASMTGTNFSSWYRQDEGSLYFDFDRVGGGIGASLESNSSNRITFEVDGGTDAMYTRVDNVVQFTGGTEVSSGKVAGAYKFNDYAISKNGGSPTTDSSARVPFINRLGIGRALFTSAYMSGTIKKLAYYPLRLTNNELVDLTEE